MGMTVFTGVQGAFGDVGCPYGARTSVAVSTTTSVLIPVGVWLCETTSGVSVRTTYDKGTNWITNVGTTAVGLVISDGLNCEFRGTASSAVAYRSQIQLIA